MGLPVWYAFWARLQREAAAPEARRSLARRIYLFLGFGASVLTLLGSGAYTLYQLLRAVLGEPRTGAQTGDSINAASAAAIAGLFLAYHLRVFRADTAVAADAPDDGTLADAGDIDGTESAPANGSPSAAPGPVPAAVPVLVICAADSAVLDALAREPRERARDGLEIARADLDPKLAARLLRRDDQRAEDNHS